MINLGDLVKDSISGFKGIAVARTEWLNGCVRISIQPNKVKDDGTLLDNNTFDIEQVVLIKAKKQQKAKPSGGDRQNIGRAATPSRI